MSPFITSTLASQHVPLSLPITRSTKWKIQWRKKKNTNLNYPKLQNRDETTLKLCISLALEPQGVFLGTRERGARGTTPGPKPRLSRGRTAAASPSRPRYLGKRARRFERRAVMSVPCQLLLPVSSFGPLVLTNQLF